MSAMPGISNANFSYDAAGNLTASPVGYSYTWNAEGRMATAVAGGVTYTYTYNGDGQRVKKAAASASSYDKLYWYGLGGEVLAESDLAGTLTSEYMFMGATRLARRDVANGNTYYFLGDRLGNARIVANATGGIVEESDFLPYGTERTITDSLDNNYKFTAHERDAESGLDHTLHRQHSSTLGKWLSPDSVRGKVGYPQTWNRYGYGGSSPCNFSDPDGAETICTVIGFDSYTHVDCRTRPNPGVLSPPSQPTTPGSINYRTYRDDNYNGLDKPTAFDRADVRMTAAAQLLSVMLSGELSASCASTLDTLGVSAADLYWRS